MFLLLRNHPHLVRLAMNGNIKNDINNYETIIMPETRELFGNKKTTPICIHIKAVLFI